MVKKPEDMFDHDATHFNILILTFMVIVDVIFSSYTKLHFIIVCVS